MQKRLPTLCHLFPGVSPMTARSMRWDDWNILARAIDVYIADQKEANSG